MSPRRADRRKKPAKIIPPTARPRTYKTNVSSPTVPGAVEHLDRVVDSVELMRRSGQLSEREWRAAEIFRRAWETVTAGIGGALDFDRVRSGAVTSPIPSPAQFAAAETLSEAKRALYREDHTVVALVAGEGHHLVQAAVLIFGDPPTRGEKEECGRRLREGLHQLARRWIRLPQSTKACVWHADDAIPTGPSADVVVPARVAHAGGRHVYRSGH